MNQVTYQNRTRQVVSRPRTVGMAYLIFFLTAMIGLHMFYLKRPGMAVAKFLTINFFFVGMVIDAVMMPKHVERANSM
jgi:TM2 domain-containing membrane protein YozV